MTAERRIALPAMDGLRAGAALLVVSMHAAAAYMSVPFPEVLWTVRDPSTSRWFDWVFLWANGVSMPLFFFLAGFFAAKVHDERGPREFLWHRTKRILLPFIVACVVILPVTFYVWAGGWLLSGRCTLKEILRVQFNASIQPDLYGPAHLWFLEYLFLLCLLFAAVEAVRGRRDAGNPVKGWPVLYVCATALILLADPRAPIHFHNSFVPNPGRFLYHGVFLAAGVSVWRNKRPCVGSRQQSALYVGVSMIAFYVVASLVPSHLGAGIMGWERLLLAATMAVFVWCALIGFTGFAQHVYTRERAAVSYVAAASYWIYLVHFPVVGLAQIGLSQLPEPAALKYVAVFSTAMCVSLLSYERLVRYTFIGTWLNGTRRVVANDDPTPRTSAAITQAG